MDEKRINIAIAGLGFGAEFIPIYQKHPQANMAAICQRTQSKLDEIGNAFGIDNRYTSFEEMIKDPSIDAVHINTTHTRSRCSKYCRIEGRKTCCLYGSDATSVEDCKKIVDIVNETGLTYMMMETVIYSREFLFVKEMYEKGELGKIQFSEHRTNKKWRAGQDIGKAYLLCIMPPIVLALYLLYQSPSRLCLLFWVGSYR